MDIIRWALDSGLLARLFPSSLAVLRPTVVDRECGGPRSRHDRDGMGSLQNTFARATLVGLLGVAISGGVHPSVAAAADPSTSAAANKVGVLEEVIVTARRREENAQTVPIAITVVSQQAIRDNNIATLEDIQWLVPSLSVSSSNVGSRDGANISIRGQGWGSFGTTPAVVMYFNDVAIPTDQKGVTAGGPGLLFDLENRAVR